jgi:hypothetical protein
VRTSISGPSTRGAVSITPIALAALAAVLVIALMPLLQRSFRADDKPQVAAGDMMQVAIANIDDRIVLIRNV